MKHALLLLATILAVSRLSADSPAPPYAYVKSAPRGMTYFRMIPKSSEDRSDGRGIAYRVTDSGVDEELWRTEGWYSFEVYLSPDGKFLVAMGPWSIGREPDKDDLAVSFYADGKLIRQYSTADLVKNKSKVVQTVSHYFWLARDTRRFQDEVVDSESELQLLWDNTFRLKTCDGILYLFDITTGAIKEKK